MRLIIILSIVLAACFLTACGSHSTKPSYGSEPKFNQQNIKNICLIFSNNPGWEDQAIATESKWGTPLELLFAIIHQESKFNPEARPPSRSSSAYGYSQALSMTWRDYQKATKSPSARRNNFADALDFIGWYSKNSLLQARIPQQAFYKQYLAYHEGWGGYKRHSYRNKPWLIKVAKKVERRAKLYAQQYQSCTSKQNRYKHHKKSQPQTDYQWF